MNLMRSMRIAHLFRRRDESGRPDLPLLSVYRDFGVVPREGRDDNFNKPGDDLSTYSVVHPGDFVLNKMKTWQGSLGISDYYGIVSPAYFVAAPRSSEHPRYLHYLLRSEPLIAEYARHSKGIRPNQWDLPWDSFRDIRLTLPDVNSQVAIADYLDRETARIDSLIAAKRRIVEITKSRLINTARVGTSVGQELKLRRSLASIKTGGTPPIDLEAATTGGERDWYGPGDFGDQPDLEPAVRKLTPEALAAWNAPVFPAHSTLVVGIGATAGRVAYLDHEATGNQQITCLLTNSRMLPRYLMWNLWSRSDEIRATAPYTTLPILNNDFLLSLPIKVASLEDQASAVANLDRLAQVSRRIAQSLDLQVGILRERRQALITAVVTGALEIPGVAVA